MSRAGVVSAALTRAATLAAAACVPVSHFHEPHAAFAPTAGPAAGAEATAAALVGDWTGQFDAPFYARRGALRVSLRRVAHVVAGAPTTTLAGTASVAGTSTAVDSARVDRGRVVLWLQPFADEESGATVRLRLDGALAADTLGGRLRGETAATVAPERHGGWRVVRVARATR